MRDEKASETSRQDAAQEASIEDLQVDETRQDEVKGGPVRFKPGKELF